MLIHDVKEGLPEWKPAIPTVGLREMGLAGILSAGRPGRTSLMKFSTNKEIRLHPGRTLPLSHLYYRQVTLHFSTNFLVLEFPHFFCFTRISSLPKPGGWRLLSGQDICCPRRFLRPVGWGKLHLLCNFKKNS